MGLILVLYTWLRDYARVIFGGGSASKFFTLANDAEFHSVISNYIPGGYNWWAYGIGVVFSVAGGLLFYIRVRNSKRHLRRVVKVKNAK